MLMEKLRGLFPMPMIQASEFRSKYFDRDGRVRYADLSRESKSFVRDAMTLEVSVSAKLAWGSLAYSLSCSVLLCSALFCSVLFTGVLCT